MTGSEAEGVGVEATTTSGTVADPCLAFYRAIHAQAGQVLEQSFAGTNSAAMAKAHATISDMAKWAEVLSARPEADVLLAATQQYQFALFALSIGLYRSALTSLRLGLELFLSAVRWSANERELREWRRRTRDTSWAGLMDENNGVLSKSFVVLFGEALSDEAPRYRALAATVYRECSEFAHGNAHTLPTSPQQLGYNDQQFRFWHQKADAVALVVFFALAARYLADCDSGSLGQVEGVLSERLGHSPGVRAMLGITVEATDA